MDGRIILIAAAGLSGCAGLPGSLGTAPQAPAVSVLTPGPDTLRPRPRGEGAARPPAPAGAAAALGASGQTAEALDTTTEAERAAATAGTEAAAETRLGTTVASLGDPTRPGLWIETPLVSATRQGRIAYRGESVLLELRPSGGAAGSGSRISLAAMRLIGAGLTDLPQIEVFGL